MGTLTPLIKAGERLTLSYMNKMVVDRFMAVFREGEVIRSRFPEWLREGSRPQDIDEDFKSFMALAVAQLGDETRHQLEQELQQLKDYFSHETSGVNDEDVKIIEGTLKILKTMRPRSKKNLLTFLQHVIENDKQVCVLDYTGKNIGVRNRYGLPDGMRDLLELPN